MIPNPAEMPENLTYLWQWFLELSYTGRTYSGGGRPMALSSSEIWSWCQLNQVKMEPWELRIIRLLDAAWLETRSQDDGG